MTKSIDQLRILIVDDRENDLDLMVIFLQALGATLFTTAGDGEEALALLLQRHDEFDIVFTDMDMPRMNGIKLIEEMGLYPSLDNIKMVMTTDNLTHAANPPEEELVLRAFLQERNVLPLPKTGLNAKVLGQAIQQLIGL